MTSRDARFAELKRLARLLQKQEVDAELFQNEALFRSRKANLEMSILTALDNASDARKKLRSMCKVVEGEVKDLDLRSDLMDHCYTVLDHLDRVVHSLERSLLPPGITVAVTYYPFDLKKDVSKGRIESSTAKPGSVPQPGPGEERGTRLYPLVDDDGDRDK